MSYIIRSSSRSRWSPACRGLGCGGGMISLFRAATVPGEGLSPDVSLSGSVCTFAASGPDREDAGPGCAAVGRVVSCVPDPCLSVMFTSVVDIAPLGSLCACTVALVGGAACAASGSPGGACSATVGGVVATLTSVVPVS